MIRIVALDRTTGFTNAKESANATLAFAGVSLGETATGLPYLQVQPWVKDGLTATSVAAVGDTPAYTALSVKLKSVSGVTQGLYFDPDTTPGQTAESFLRVRTGNGLTVDQTSGEIRPKLDATKLTINENGEITLAGTLGGTFSVQSDTTATGIAFDTARFTVTGATGAVKNVTIPTATSSVVGVVKLGDGLENNGTTGALQLKLDTAKFAFGSSGELTLSASVSGDLPVVGTPTAGTLTKFVSDSGKWKLTNSVVSESGTTVTVGGTIAATTLLVGTPPSGTEATRLGGDVRVGGTVYATDFVLLTGSGGTSGLGLASLTADVAIAGIGGVALASGQFLRYDGSYWRNTKIVAADLGTGTANSTTVLRGDLTWGTVSGLPSQTGNAGKYLTTDGTTASWATVNAGVTSVAGRTGAITLTAADIGAGSFPSGSFTFLGSLSVTGNTLLDTNTIAVDATNHKVGMGVGVGSINAKLHVVTSAQADEVLRLEGAWSAGQTTTLLNFQRAGGLVAGALRYVQSSGLIQFGTTTSTVLELMTGSTGRWRIDTNGHWLATADATYDIGASGATRPRNVYISGSLTGNVTGALTGNASTATALQTARTLWGQSFDGTANVSGALSSVTNLTMSGTLLVGASPPSGTEGTRIGGDVRVGGTIYATDFVLVTGSGGATALGLSSLTADVALAGTGGVALASGQFLRYDGTYWRNVKIAAADLGTGTANSTTVLRGDLTWGTISGLPSQTGNSGKYLTTDGTTASWGTINALPSQTGNSGKYLTTDGTTASWVTISTGVTSVAGRTGAVTLTAADIGAGTFSGTYGFSGGTVTASTPVLDVSQTWNNSGVTFAGIKLNVTNTASASASKLVDLQVGGGSVFNVTREGDAELKTSIASKAANLTVRGSGDQYQYSSLVLANSTNAKVWYFNYRVGEAFAFNYYNGTSYATSMAIDASSGTTMVVYGKMGVGASNNGNGYQASTVFMSYEGSGDMGLQTNSTVRWKISTTGHLLAQADNSYDIGASGANRPRNIYISGTLTGNVSGALTGNADTATKLSSARTFALTGDVTGSVSSDLTSGASIATTLGTGVVTNTSVSATAAIAYSKLNLSGAIVNADISASAAIADTKLATISTAGKVSNSATTATSANTASAIVARDSSGNFTAGTVTVSGLLVGTAPTGSESTRIGGDVRVGGTVYATDFVLLTGTGGTTGLGLTSLTADVAIGGTGGVVLAAGHFLRYDGSYWRNTKIVAADLGTGTANSTTVLRGDLTWGTVSGLPSQTGNSGKYLTTDGSAASWATISVLPSQTGNSGKYLTTDGTTASWASITSAVTSVAGRTGAVTLTAADIGTGTFGGTYTFTNTITANVSGSAGSVAWTNVSGRPTAVSSFTNDSGYLTSASLSGYLTTSTAASTYVSLSGSYANPTWITSLASSKITGLATSATTDTTNAANISSGTLPSARLSGSYTGVTAVGTLSSLAVTGAITAGSQNYKVGGVSYSTSDVTAGSAAASGTPDGALWVVYS